MKYDPETLAFYDREAVAYAARPRKSISPELLDFLSRLRTGAHILDLGCGGGHDALAIQNAGFDVTAIDGSAQLAIEAEKRLRRPVRVQRFETLEDQGTFDAVWANASLLHVPKPELPAIVCRIHNALKPDGLFYASFKSGGQEGRDALGRYYNHPSKDDLIAAHPQPGWKILTINQSEGSGYDGLVTGWLSILVQKRAPLAKFVPAR